MYSWLWGLAALAALWWPGRIAGPLDGAPLDGLLEAVALGLILPALLWFRREFLHSRLARIAIVAIVLLKVGGAFLSQDGWCLRFDTAGPLVRDSTGRLHTWDARADWLAPDPVCSAVMTRGYPEFKKFPAWFFNLPPADDNLPTPNDRPPNATVAMPVLGFIDTKEAGVLEIRIGRWMEMTLLVDGRPAERPEPLVQRIALEPGLHFVEANVALTGDEWLFLPSWNQAAFGSRAFPTSTTTRPGRADARALRIAVSWLTTAIALLLIGGWLASALSAWRYPSAIAWTLGAAAWLAYLAPRPGNGFVTSSLARWSISALALAALVPMPERARTLRGAFLVVGIPWLAFTGVASFDHIGRFSLYAAGDDHWMFQRFAYRIFLQGYWLEGGSATFWFQPFYRWIAGGWHMVFGDSSVGEFFWDGACLLAMAMFAHEVTSRVAGFRWGLVAAVATLTVIMQGPTWGYFGSGLSENAGAGLIYMAALTALNARGWPAMLGAGLLATLGFYTRPNSLPIVGAVALFALPLSMTVQDGSHLARWPGRRTLVMAGLVLATIAIGVLLFAVRMWYYTGVFSIVHGSSMAMHAVWQPGLTWWALGERMAASVLMLLTMNDPARFAWYAMPLMAAAVICVATIVGIPRVRDLPLPLVLFFLAGCSGALVAKGDTYAQRFSTILIGAGCAVTVCALAKLTSRPARIE